ncbi:MAG: sulfatase [Verrucomicrobia bacterium]|nr:sulfatase [Verrucomicrobiota bacterium]
MPKPNFLLWSCLLIATIAGAADRRPPNFVFILADDLGTPPVAAYGNSFYRTPHLDGLARDGLRFTDAYAACPVCSPTRAALMTGQYPARTRVTDFIPGAPYPYARLKQPEWQKFLPLSATTLAEALAARGYATALIGKWHLAKGYFPPESVAEGPDRQGFGESFITHKPKKTDDPEQDPHGVEAITTRALDFLARHRERPFFLYLPHNSIHAPIIAPRALVAKHRARPGADRPENNPVIAAMMEVLDDSIGRVLGKLDALGLRENTLVIFYGDNGGLLADAAQFPFRGGKAQLHEGGIRVPLIVRWPGTIAAGRVSAAPVTTVDFFPTLLELADASPPPGVVLDGVSLAGHLRGAPPPPRDAIFWHYPHYHSAGDGGPAGAVRAGEWKLVEYYEHTLTQTGRAPELYNLRADPAESRNLASAEPARVAELRAKLTRFRQSTNAQMPALNPAFDPARAKQSGPKSAD